MVSKMTDLGGKVIFWGSKVPARILEFLAKNDLPRDGLGETPDSRGAPTGGIWAKNGS